MKLFVLVLVVIEEVGVSVDRSISSSSCKATFHPYYNLAVLTCSFYSLIPYQLFCTAVANEERSNCVSFLTCMSFTSFQITVGWLSLSESKQRTRTMV